MLTIKSDDIDGREKLIRSIIRGKKLPLPGMPESFKLLTKQLQGLCLSMSAELENGDIVDINKYTNDIDIDDENDENASNDQQEKNTTFLEEINE
jgi:DNA-directed RNA polymerase subunit beta